MPTTHTVFIILNAFMWVMLYRCYNTNPGFLSKNSPDYDRAIRQASVFFSFHLFCNSTYTKLFREMCAKIFSIGDLLFHLKGKYNIGNYRTIKLRNDYLESLLGVQWLQVSIILINYPSILAYLVYSGYKYQLFFHLSLLGVQWVQVSIILPS